MPKQTVCLWFDTQAEQAAEHYCSIFPNSTITGVHRYGPDQPGPEGEVMLVMWTLDGYEYTGVNGGPLFTFDEAISVQIDCADQAEVDYYWQRLAEGGQESMCGWLKDKFGLSWQVIPSEMGVVLSDPDPGRRNAAMQAMLQMRKIDIAALKAAADAAG